MTVLDDPRSSPHAQDAQDLFEEARRRRCRRNRRWGALMVLVASIAAVTVVTVAHNSRPRGSPSAGQRPPANGAAATPVPPEMVIWSNFWRIEVISSTTGHLIRTLATDVALDRGTPQPTVSPIGTVYFDDAGTRPNEEQILSVPLSGGPITFVANGHDPAVSPDGQYLAYLTDVNIPNVAWLPQAIVVQDLLTGATKAWRYSNPRPDITRLTWAPDSQTLAFSAVTPTRDRVFSTLGAWVLPVSSPSGSLAEAREIPLPRGMAWASYVNQTQGIVVSQRSGPTGRGFTFRLSIVDVATGRVVTRLPALLGRLGVDNISDGAEGRVEVDPSGQHLAVVEAGAGNGTLFRWTIGRTPSRAATKPIQVATGLFGVAWVPAR